MDTCATTNAVTAQSYTLLSDLVTPGWNNSTMWSKVASSTPITTTTNQPVNFNDTSLVLPSGVDNLQAVIKDLHNITSEPTSLVLATDPLPEKYHTLKQKARQLELSESSHDDLTQEMFNKTRDSAYLEGIENEAEEEEEEDKSGKSAHPLFLDNLTYILSTSHVKEIPVLLKSASTFIEMVQQWQCSTHKEEMKAEQTYTCLEGTWKKQCCKAAELGAKAPNKPKRPAPIMVYIILSNTSSIAQDDKSKDKVKGKGKGKNPKKSNSPHTSLEEQRKGLYGQADIVLPGGVHWDPSDQDWSFWNLALSRKVPNVTETEPPGNIMDKWITISETCQSEGPLCQATCPLKCQAVDLYLLLGQDLCGPPLDGIDVSIPSPLLKEWLEKSVDGNPQWNSDQHNFSQYLDAFIKAGLYHLGELAAVGSMDKLLDTYHLSKPKERMLCGTAVVLLNYARVDFKQLCHQAR
ncbi:hypothetical protein DACRYDRAFT_17145 [Dacryopinax primogenitus]|uniref:Uncharacterized protein n=1 Tax=Dacryopinax primogenitus (strain DJM 731) TaxID=1858805 RepID=M5G8K7_DACPD|nr:uncharacterized protein DACRYDRAFT_17145 [Dacryopinax primogenitus]EJU00103.1 hypothetical protein DACRYDRAFT_17145 [Dacryopinax primogenitus]